MQHDPAAALEQEAKRLIASAAGGDLAARLAAAEAAAILQAEATRRRQANPHTEAHPHGKAPASL